MKRGVRAGIAGLLFGSMLAGCGVAPELESPQGHEALEASTSTEAGLDAARDDSQPAALARFGPAVAYGDGKYFAVWTDVRTGGIWGTRVKPDGTVLDKGGIRINTSDLSGSRPGIAFNGTHFFVVWGNIDGIDGVRVKPDGTVVGPVFRVIQTDEFQGPTRVACSPKICLVTYTVTGDDGSVIYVTRVTKDGVVLPSNDRSVGGGSNYSADASVAWNNSRKEFLVVWSTGDDQDSESADIYGNRVKEDGTILDDDGFPISTAVGAQTTPDVEWTGKNYQVVWSDTRNGNPDIYGARVNGQGKVKDAYGIPITRAAAAQTAPRIAHHNNKSLVVWDDTRNGPHSIWGSRWDEDGDVWDGSGFPISSGGLAQHYLPDVAYGSDRFFTVYAAQNVYEPYEPHFIVGTRVTHQAQVKDVPAIPLTRTYRD